MAIELRPMPVRSACSEVKRLHRHLPRIIGGLFAVAAFSDGDLVGVAIASLPRARQTAPLTVEITRCAADGQANACSRLYAALCRASAAVGFLRAITYTRPEEPGTSLRAAGFQDDGLTRAESWDRAGRARVAGELIQRRRWVRALQEPRRSRVEQRRVA